MKSNKVGLELSLDEYKDDFGELNETFGDDCVDEVENATFLPLAEWLTFKSDKL
jgi:hypothetical protein